MKRDVMNAVLNYVFLNATDKEPVDLKEVRESLSIGRNAMARLIEKIETKYSDQICVRRHFSNIRKKSLFLTPKFYKFSISLLLNPKARPGLEDGWFAFLDCEHNSDQTLTRSQSTPTIVGDCEHNSDQTLTRSQSTPTNAHIQKARLANTINSIIYGACLFSPHQNSISPEPEAKVYDEMSWTSKNYFMVMREKFLKSVNTPSTKEINPDQVPRSKPVFPPSMGKGQTPNLHEFLRSGYRGVSY